MAADRGIRQHFCRGVLHDRVSLLQARIRCSLWLATNSCHHPSCGLLQNLHGTSPERSTLSSMRSLGHAGVRQQKADEIRFLISSTSQTLQTYLPRMCANASNSAHSWTAEEPAGHPHLPWVSEICSTAERACWIPASPFSQLLHARRALIGHEFDNFFVEHPERIRSNRPSAGALCTELPSTVILGLTTFNVVLKSLCAERHDLEVEVTSSVCSVLQGLPPLTEVKECEASVLDSLEKLLMDLVDTSISRVALCEADAERIGGSLKALFLLSLLRSSLTGIVRAAHLTFRAEEALVAAGCRADAIKMDISGPHLEALKELCEGGGFGDDLSPLSDDSTILGDFNDDVVMGARPNLVFSNSYSSIATDGRYLYKHTLNVRSNCPHRCNPHSFSSFLMRSPASYLIISFSILTGNLKDGLRVRIRSKQALPRRLCPFRHPWLARSCAGHRGLCARLAVFHAPRGV